MLLLFLAMQAVHPMPVARVTPNAAIAAPALRRQQMIDDAHALLDRAERTRKLYRPGASLGQLNKTDLDAQVGQLKSQLDSMSEMGETESLRLQMAMDRLSKLMSTLSNMLKKMSDTDAGITNNIK